MIESLSPYPLIPHPCLSSLLISLLFRSSPPPSLLSSRHRHQLPITPSPTKLPFSKPALPLATINTKNENKTAGGGLSFLLETEDIEGDVANAVKAGAISDGEIEEGDNALRLGKVKDQYGMIWAMTSPTIVKKMKKSEEENENVEA